jgi:hypothetical protein
MPGCNYLFCCTALNGHKGKKASRNGAKSLLKSGSRLRIEASAQDNIYAHKNNQPEFRAGITADVRGLAEQEKGSGPARSGSLGGKGRDGGEQKVGGEQEDAEGAERREDEQVEAEDNSESSDERRARRR